MARGLFDSLILGTSLWIYRRLQLDHKHWKLRCSQQTNPDGRISCVCCSIHFIYSFSVFSLIILEVENYFQLCQDTIRDILFNVKPQVKEDLVSFLFHREVGRSWVQFPARSGSLCVEFACSVHSPLSDCKPCGHVCLCLHVSLVMTRDLPRCGQPEHGLLICWVCITEAEECSSPRLGFLFPHSLNMFTGPFILAILTLPVF